MVEANTFLCHGALEFLWLNLHYGPSMMSQEKTPRGLYSFDGGLSPGKAPLWRPLKSCKLKCAGSFQLKCPNRNCKDLSGSFQWVFSSVTLLTVHRVPLIVIRVHPLLALLIFSEIYWTWMNITGHRAEVRFASFLSGGFTTMAIMNPPEKNLERTSVQCMWVRQCYMWITIVVVQKPSNQVRINYLWWLWNSSIKLLFSDTHQAMFVSQSFWSLMDSTAAFAWPRKKGRRT